MRLIFQLSNTKTHSAHKKEEKLWEIKGELDFLFSLDKVFIYLARRILGTNIE